MLGSGIGQLSIHKLSANSVRTRVVTIPALLVIRALWVLAGAGSEDGRRRPQVKIAAKLKTPYFIITRYVEFTSSILTEATRAEGSEARTYTYIYIF